MEELEQLQEMLRTHHRLTTLAKAAKAEADTLSQQIEILSQKHGMRQASFISEDGEMVQATIPVRGVKETIDESKLKSRLKQVEWIQITKLTLDPVALEQWLTGPDDDECERRLLLVQQAMETKPGPRPAPRYKVVQATPDEMAEVAPKSEPPRIVTVKI